MPQVMGPAARTLGGDTDAAAAVAYAGRRWCGLCGAGGGVFGRPVQAQGLTEPGECGRVACAGGLRQRGGRPADTRVLGDGDTELLGLHLEPGVVVAALPARVFDPSHVREGVGGFVQQGAEDPAGSALQAFPTAEHLGQLLAVFLVPAHRGEVPEPQATTGRADRPVPEHDHRRGDLGVLAADVGPGVFEGGDHGCADRLG